MIRNRPTVDDPEIRLKVVRNLSTQTLVRGDSCCYLAPNDPGAGTTPSGIVVGIPTTAERGAALFAGVVYDDAGIAVGALGLIQTSGFANYALVAGHSADPTGVGDYLKVTTLTTTMALSSSATHAVAMEAIAALAPVAARAILLRCPE